MDVNQTSKSKAIVGKATLQLQGEDASTTYFLNMIAQTNALLGELVVCKQNNEAIFKKLMVIEEAFRGLSNKFKLLVQQSNEQAQDIPLDTLPSLQDSLNDLEVQRQTTEDMLRRLEESISAIKAAYSSFLLEATLPKQHTETEELGGDVNTNE